MSVRAFDPVQACATLSRHGVRYVVIGGFAARLWGSPTVTNDLDICYARDSKNMRALARALREMGARLRGAPEDVPFLLDEKTLEAGDHFTLATTSGNLDCLGFPAGSGGYDALERSAAEMDLGAVRAKVAALEDLIGMKRAAGRPKDRVELEVLGALQQEIERLEDSTGR